MNKYFLDKGWKVSKGDIIRIGEKILRIRKIKDHHEYFYQKKLSKFQEIQGLCRICFSEDNLKENPLLNICKCIGSVRYVHKNCLQEWIKTKLKSKQNINFYYINWKKMICEICKSQYNCNYLYIILKIIAFEYLKRLSFFEEKSYSIT